MRKIAWPMHAILKWYGEARSTTPFRQVQGGIAPSHGKCSFGLMLTTSNCVSTMPT